MHSEGFRAFKHFDETKQYLTKMIDMKGINDFQHNFMIPAYDKV